MSTIGTNRKENDFYNYDIFIVSAIFGQITGVTKMFPALYQIG